MKIKLTSVPVDDQEKTLRIYTEVLGFVKKADFGQGPYRWLTVTSPEDPDGTELQLALNDNPAAKAYQQALFRQGQPAAMFFSDDVHAEYEGMKARGAEFTMPPDRRARRQDRQAERYLRKCHSGLAAEASIGSLRHGHRSHSSVAFRHRDKEDDMNLTLERSGALAPMNLSLPRSKGIVIAFWVVTALFCLEMIFTAYYELLVLPEAAQAFTRLGFPADYFRVELSWAKVAGVAALLIPMVPARLKEWAYAGFAINLVSASSPTSR
jgi:catechol 2,3-dioxygenase-like lactoylglutathione lyase family enzyme